MYSTCSSLINLILFIKFTFMSWFLSITSKTVGSLKLISTHTHRKNSNVNMTFETRNTTAHASIKYGPGNHWYTCRTTKRLILAKALEVKRCTTPKQERWAIQIIYYTLLCEVRMRIGYWPRSVQHVVMSHNYL